jgi:hypothetical protein
MRSGLPVASLRWSLRTQSARGSNSSQPRSVTAKAARTASEPSASTGEWALAFSEIAALSGWFMDAKKG